MIRPKIFEPFPNLAAAQSTRHGGVSASPFDSLNLGKSTADALENVQENRRRFCQALGFEPQQMAWSRQVHGSGVLEVNSPGGHEGFDALITQSPDVLLAVSVADCAPVLVFDQRNKAIAAIHAGWRGTAAQIVRLTLERMAKSYGTRGMDCIAYIGACIDECSFEVGEAVAQEFDVEFKRWDSPSGKFFVDLKKANAAQLLDFGLSPAQIERSPYCTFKDHHDFFSHRKSGGTTGRGMGVIGIKNR